MKGGEPPLVGNVKSNPTNLFPLNLSPVNNKSRVNTMNSTINTMTPTVNSNNSQLNKIKNKLFPEGTISGLAMKLTKISKNSNNPANDKYSFEIIYKIDGNNDIKKLVFSNITFTEFLQHYRKSSTDVFPPPQKRTNNVKAATATATNGTVKAAAATNGTVKANSNGTVKANANGTVKPNSNGTVNANANKALNLGF